MEDYLSKLNEQQRRAVEYLDGPSLVIAGAGSGKTRVLTYKIVHLLAKGYEPYRIMALTFTNKAAREMRERIHSLVGGDVASKLWMGTFHSIFLRILRRHASLIGFKSDFTIYDTSDSKSLVKTIIKDMQLDDKVYKPNTVQAAISMAKNALLSPEAYEANRELVEADRRCRRPMISAIYRAYKSRCAISNAMDFDDLLYYTNVLLRDNPDVCNHYREFFRYILVDEYQDTNFAQHLIVSRLTSDADNLCVVGDDAQSIYSFRGANIKNILNLRNAYPNLATFKLEQNYRSTQTIINAANTLIAKNRNQIPKQVFSRNSVGSRIDVVKCYSDYEESFKVATHIANLKREEPEDYDEYAILYRTNAQSRILEESLRKRNIPYRIYGGLSFYQRKEVKDAIAYFRLAVNPDDDEALRRVINYPARGIGDTTLNKLTQAANDGRKSIWDVIGDVDTVTLGMNAGTRRKLNDFRQLIQSFIDANASGVCVDELAVKIIRDTRLLSSLITDHTPESISKQENLQELLNGVSDFAATQREQEGNDNPTISQYLSQVSLLTDQDIDNSDTPRVTLMTVHAAKGLEFANVFIVGLEEELFPSAMSSGSPGEIEEERRLLYVAITRAKKYCMMSYASSRFRNGQTATCSPSRFLRDIEGKYLNISAGSSLDGGNMFDPVGKYRDSFHSSSSVSGNTQQSYSSSGQYRSKYFARGGSDASAVESNRKPVSAGPSVPAGGSSDFRVHGVGELSQGMSIEHERFGIGTIQEIDTSNDKPRIVVKFSNLDIKTLLLQFARFKVV
ncbi:MAG: UvrD-helicase domain-containing protein [Muribaculaceae bacterium]|nr:UvrD-helicase domain-containing protein [Muribaculaceae bacterium]